jgi:hypothetical protein
MPVKMIILSAVATLILAYAAALILDREQEPAYQAFVGSGARVGNPGSNLVGPEWTGEPRPPQS